LEAPGDSNEEPEGANPNLSAFSPTDPVPISLDTDPANRWMDRLMAVLGLLEDAAPLFRSEANVPRAGVLLAVPVLIESGVFSIAREVYGSIGPAFCGLRTTMLALLLMARLRTKRPEGLKEHSPADLGRVLGLDRAPEVKPCAASSAAWPRSATPVSSVAAWPSIVSGNAAPPWGSYTWTGTCASTTASTPSRRHT
jgi:hypothetical protein